MLKLFYTGIEQEFLGETYQKDLGTSALSIPVLVVGAVQESGTDYFELLAEDADNEYAMIDATIVRAHQHSAGAKDSSTEQEDIGRSKGGLSTKIHGVVDALGNPTHFF